MTENYITHFETEAPECDAPQIQATPPYDFGANLRRLRWERDLSLRDVTRGCGVPHAVVNRYERGVEGVKIALLYRLCQYYGVTADELLGFTKRRRENAG